MVATTDEVAAVLEARGVSKEFKSYGALGVAKGSVSAVSDVSIRLGSGESLGLVGESGSGKSTLGRLLAALTPASAGSVLYKGQAFNPGNARQADWKTARREVQVVFQDPAASLNPRLRVGDSLAEGLRVRGEGGYRANRDAVTQMMGLVGVPRDAAHRYPTEFSGGQLQRIAIGRALLVEPHVLIADEPVSSLDLLVQAQILRLLRDLQDRLRFSMLFISHNMAVVYSVATRVAVMYAGRMVELAPTAELYSEPLHPYTVVLLSAVPALFGAEHGERRKQIVRQTVANQAGVSATGCPFRSRCPGAQQECTDVRPELREIRPGHFAACHFPGVLALSEQAASTRSDGSAR